MQNQMFLVEQIMNDDVDIEKIDKSKLPKEIQALPAAKQTEAIQQKVAERKQLQKEMDALVKKRTEFITAEKAKQAEGGAGESFDMKVKKMISEQGKSKGIKFSK